MAYTDSKDSSPFIQQGLYRAQVFAFLTITPSCSNTGDSWETLSLGLCCQKCLHCFPYGDVLPGTDEDPRGVLERNKGVNTPLAMRGVCISNHIPSSHRMLIQWEKVTTFCGTFLLFAAKYNPWSHPPTMMNHHEFPLSMCSLLIRIFFCSCSLFWHLASSPLWYSVLWMAMLPSQQDFKWF